METEGAVRAASEAKEEKGWMAEAARAAAEDVMASSLPLAWAVSVAVH